MKRVSLSDRNDHGLPQFFYFSFSFVSHLSTRFLFVVNLSLKNLQSFQAGFSLFSLFLLFIMYPANVKFPSRSFLVYHPPGISSMFLIVKNIFFVVHILVGTYLFLYKLSPYSSLEPRLSCFLLSHLCLRWMRLDTTHKFDILFFVSDVNEYATFVVVSASCRLNFIVI